METPRSWEFQSHGTLAKESRISGMEAVRAPQATKLLELENKSPGSRRGLQDLVFSMPALSLALVLYLLIMSPFLLLAAEMYFLFYVSSNYVICFFLFRRKSQFIEHLTSLKEASDLSSVGIKC